MTAQDLDNARAKLAEDMKIDILSLTQEDENVKARHEVSRTFLCMFIHNLIVRSINRSLQRIR